MWGKTTGGALGNSTALPGGPAPSSHSLGGRYPPASHLWSLCSELPTPARALAVPTALACFLSPPTRHNVRSLLVHMRPQGPHRGRGSARAHPGWHLTNWGPWSQVQTSAEPQPASCPWPQGWHRIKFPLKGTLKALACGPGSEPLIRRWQLSRKAFNVVQWYFSDSFSEQKS